MVKIKLNTNIILDPDDCMTLAGPLLLFKEMRELQFMTDNTDFDRTAQWESG